MNRSCLCLVIVLSGTEEVASWSKAQGDDRPRRFISAMEKIRDTIDMARFELDGQMVIPARSIWHTYQRGKYYPIEDATGDIQRTLVLDFHGKRIRNDFRGFELFETKESMAPATVRHITTFNGKTQYRQYPRIDANTRFFDSNSRWEMVDQGDDAQAMTSVFFKDIYPVLFACGRLQRPNANFRIDRIPDLRASELTCQGTSSRNGVETTVFRYVHAPPPQAIYTEYNVDSNDFSRILGVSVSVQAQTAEELRIEYAGDSRIPSAWTYFEFDAQNPDRRGKLSHQTRYEVRHAVFNQSEADSEFEPDLKPGMRVRTAAGVQQVSRDGKTFEPVGFVSRRRYYIGAFVMVTLMMTAFWLLYRRRRSPPQLQQGSRKAI